MILIYDDSDDVAYIAPQCAAYQRIASYVLRQEKIVTSIFLPFT